MPTWMRGSGAIQQRLVSGASKTFMVSTSAGVTPNAKDQITDGGTDYEVVEVKALAPGDTTLLWYVDVKA